VTIIVSKPGDITVVKHWKLRRKHPGQKLTFKNRRLLLWDPGTRQWRSWTYHIMRK
jgi:hypothetical protein